MMPVAKDMSSTDLHINYGYIASYILVPLFPSSRGALHFPFFSVGFVWHHKRFIHKPFNAISPILFVYSRDSG